MTTRSKYLKLFLMVLADSTLLVAALLGACLLRFEPPVCSEQVRQMIALAPLIVPAEVVLFARFGLYRGLGRRTGGLELWRLALACFLSMLFALACATFFGLHLSWSVLIIEALLGFVMAGTLRVGIRTLCEARTIPGACALWDGKIRTCPLCGREAKRVDRAPPELAASWVYPIR